MLRLIHCLWEAEKRKRGGGSRRRNETESRSRNKDLETKRKEGWHRGMHKSCLFLHLLKLNIHTNYKAEMKNTGRLIWIYPFKQWNYFLNDFFPCQFLCFPCNAFSFLTCLFPFFFSTPPSFVLFSLLLSASFFLFLSSLALPCLFCLALALPRVPWAHEEHEHK